MSALLAPAGEPEEEAGRRKRLRSVPDPPPRLAPMPFLVVLIGLLGIGLAGLLMLNTSLQGNAFVMSHIEVFARGVNLTNERYAETATYDAFQGAQYVPGMPRTVFAGVRYEWRAR